MIRFEKVTPDNFEGVINLKLRDDQVGFLENNLYSLAESKVFDYLEGNASLEETAERIKKETRHFAKRQLTWFRRDGRIRWLYLDETDEDGLFEQAVKLIKDEGWRKGEEDEEFEPAGRVSQRGEKGS